MKSGLSWNLRGVDDETREAVLEAARRSGLSVGQWLNSVLAEEGVEHGEPEDLDVAAPAGQGSSVATLTGAGDDGTRDAAELAEAIEQVTKRLGELDERARASIPNLKDRLDEIEHHVGELSDTGMAAAEQKELLKRVSALIDGLGADIEAATQKRRPKLDEIEAAAEAAAAAVDKQKHPAIDIDRVTAAISDLDQRIAAMGQKLAAPAPTEIRPLRLDDIRQRLDTLLAQTPRAAAPAPAQTAAIESALRALEGRIDNAKAQLEARIAAREAEAQAQAELEARSATTEQIARIEDRLAEIAARIAAAEEARQRAAAEEAERQKPKKEAVLSTAIREISAHQRTIDDRAETLAMRRDQKVLAAAMAALRNEIGALGEQVSAISRVGQEEHGAFFELSRRIDAMAAEQPIDRSILSAMQADLKTMRDMAEGAARQDALSALEARHADMAAQLGELIRMAPDREKLEGLGEEVAALRQTLEADDSPNAIARLEERVADLGSMIETAVANLQEKLAQPNPAVQQLEGRLSDIASRIETLNEAGASAHSEALSIAEERLQGRMDEIASRLGGLLVTVAKPQAAAIENVEKHLAGRLDDIVGRVTTLADTRAQTEAIENAQRQMESRLEQIVDRLGAAFDTRTQDAALEHVHERLQAITDRIETLSASQREPSAALDAIKSEIGKLRGEIAEKEAPPVPNTDFLEAQIQSLAQQINAVSGTTESEVKALADLETQVAALASELEQSKPRASALKTLEDRLDRLQGLLSDTAKESIQSARSEARKAVDELAQMVAGNDIDSGTVRGLMRDLDSLRNAAGSSDTATRSKLESVSATMTQVVDRLAKLEKETTEAASKQAQIQTQAEAKATGTHGAAQQPVARLDAATLLWKSGFRPAADGGTKIPEAVRAVTAEKPAPTAQPAQPEKNAADRRADFIAAARRAAQAAQQEAAAMEASEREVPEVTPEAGQPPMAERKPGAFSRISRAIRNRKRPLLLAAAAILLAIGAMQLYGKVAPGIGGDDSAALVATAAPDVAPLQPVSVYRDVTVPTPPASTVPDMAATPLVPPPATPDAALAFAPPTTTGDRFAPTDDSSADDAPAAVAQTDANTAPDTTAITGSTDTAGDLAAAATPPPPADEASAAPPPSADDASAAPMDAPATGPVVLASAPASLPANIDTAGLDPRLGSPKLLSAAASGDPAAEYEIATRYAEGARVAKDLSKAAAWYKKAAEGGIAVAQYRLGSFYERGQGVNKDLVSAVDWYQRAADQGNVNAMHNLAVLLSEGVDGQADHDKALQWFLAAANYGVRDSQYNLGVIYARGLGTAQDLSESYKWFAVAAAQGDTDASARRDEVAKAMTPDDLARARAAATAWQVKTPIQEANAVSGPDGGWDSTGDTITASDRQGLVKKIQTLLAEAGYDPGPADGVAGPKTVDAVRAYQRTAGLPETGQIDTNLVAMLSDGQ